MNYLTQNIRYIRKREKLTQQQFAGILQIKRSLLGAYEEGRAFPKVTVVQKLADLSGFTIDALISSDLKNCQPGKKQKKELQILPVVVNSDNRELIPIVPVKASAGYLTGFSDPEYISQLPVFSMPVPELSAERTYRVFQIKGDSMLPVQPGSYIFCEFVPSLSEIKNGNACVLVTKDDGIVYKRIYRENDLQLLLVSDNREYSPYRLGSESVLEIWKGRGILTFGLD